VNFQSFRGFAIFSTIAFLSSCASLPEVPKEVRIPYPVPCLESKDLPAKPPFLTDSEMAKMTDADLVISLRTDQLNYRGYLPLVEALIQACVK
jgi:hypothetical protein